ncbi:hydrolase glyoxylase [Sutcliffiella cohnii]|uniref:Hydrolase glyoxylase n=1 Tax=Sutcliffiella cohnii TaxID=33932 RepID=A0A223KR20_9BACI|nr:MBL fold metallo-hydrolase [Sutcliffiella cohnii]AST91922.1 hydrolase glyoxylase [Sutcliffiella cohnii]
MFHFQENNITVFQSSLYMTSTAVIQSNEAIIMTDPNWLPDEIKRIRAFIDKHLGNKDLYIIYTHSDFDHIIGSGAFPEAKVIASEEFVNNPNKEEIVQRIFEFHQGYYIERDYVPTYPEVDIPIVKNGQHINLGELSLTFYKAPGHTNDSLFTVIEPYGIFLSGDYLSDVEFPFIFNSYKDYVDTIEKASYIINNYEIKYHIPGHGSATRTKQEMLDRINFSKNYLQQLMNDNGDLENKCRTKFRFFEGMKSIHDDNKRIAKEENLSSINHSTKESNS